MAKNQTVDRPVSIFSLSRFKVGCYYNTVSVDFTSTQRYSNSKLRPNNHFESIVPKFNHDRNCHTPAFILPNEQVRFDVSLALLLEEHRVREGKIRRKNPHRLRKKLKSGTFLFYFLDSRESSSFLNILPDLQRDLLRLLRSHQF